MSYEYFNYESSTWYGNIHSCGLNGVHQRCKTGDVVEDTQDDDI